MKSPETIVTCVILFLLTGVYTTVFGQFQQLPAGLKPGSSDEASLSISARQAEERLSLPFWDDFSSNVLNSSLWDNQGATRSTSIGVDPPSLGVVYLDGVDDLGNPYSRERLANGEGDRLTSLPIDLSNLSATEKQTVFLSFFWQAGGRGEMPDDTDQLEVQFLSATGDWVVVWEQMGGDHLDRHVFVQEILQVAPEFLHDNFRFRFQYIGRLSGPFDTWVLDYVYLHKNRNANDRFYEDRALSLVPNSPLGRYTAYPLFWLEELGEEGGQRLEGQFNNLSNRFRAMEFTVTLSDAQTGALIRTVNANTPLIPVPLAQERRNFFSNPINDLNGLPSEGFDLETTLYLSTGDLFKVARVVGRDTVFEPSIDFRLNDTVRTVTPLRDFMAYDDGSAEYAAGINQTSGMLALRYQAPEPAYVTGVSINFTNYLQRGNALELMVWDSLTRNAVHRQEILIPDFEDIGDFAYFPIDTNVRVSGSFFVGFMQFTNDFIYVGLDKTTDTGEEVFFNVYGEWQQNESVEGSLMIRPHLSLQPPVEGRIPESEAAVFLYPNPTYTENVVLVGAAERIMVFDFQGREINVPIERTEQGNLINFANRQKGLYLVRVLAGNKWNAIRLIIK
ncbi:MAG: T9SS type A sorting domain-containing protein [Lunatimonas sp.]|uniref:T9SS type A sorting domain-containing protein n=1 Tax=Lunatimonas sp. TaxID=2060141 RepID=UPI00263BBE97|nr:T9SS type A sorting domain-containing protein [Lunatimonas sp.]MCC5936898.1 T9SS type A sorting domain-containing protein [Lunatimonas sp.]